MFVKCPVIYKAISIKKLKDILNCIPENYLITATHMNDFMILKPDESPEGLIRLDIEYYDPELYFRK